MGNIKNFVKLLRNATLFDNRELALVGLKSQLSQLSDGEICVASFKTSDDIVKSIFGVVRVVDDEVSYTIFDIDGEISNLNYTDSAVENQYVSSVTETGGKIKVERDTLTAAKTKYTNEMTVEAALKKLMDKNYPLTVSCSISPTALQEVGKTGVTVTINNFKATIDGKVVQPSKITVNNTEVTGSSFTDVISETKSYNVVFTYDGRTAAITKTVTFVGPIYVGYSSEVTASETDMTSLTDKQSLRTSLGTITFNKSTSVSGGQYVTIYVPSTMAVKNVLSGGLDIISEFTSSTFTYKGLGYTCYRHKSKTTSAELTIK